MKILNPNAPSFHPPQPHHYSHVAGWPKQIPHTDNNLPHPHPHHHRRPPPNNRGRKGHHRRRQTSVPPRFRRKNEAAGYGGRRVQPPAEKAKKVPPLVKLVEYGRDITTIMIRNIPNRYTREMLIDFVDKHCFLENQKLADKKGSHTESAFDLVYLPIDFDTHLNKGYGFVNFTNPDAAWRFHLGTNGQKWEFFHSHKVRHNVAARYQGKENLMLHLETMKLPSNWEEIKPVCFSPPRDGTNKGGRRTLGKPAERIQRSLGKPAERLLAPCIVRSHWIEKANKNKSKKTPSPAAVHNVSSEAT